MLRLLIFLILLVASVWIGLEIVRHQGYLLIVYKPWLVQMPIWFAVLALVVFFLLFYLLITSIDRVYFWWFKFKNWLRFRREHRSFSKTQQGLAMLLEARYKKAERFLLAGVTQSVEPLMNYLGAATAAQEQGAYDRRDNYIKKAYQVAPNAELAIGITQAELELKQDQLEQAAATLNHLLTLSPRHPRVLQLLEKVYIRMADWQNLLTLVYPMRKAKLLTTEQAELFEKNLYAELLQHSLDKSIEGLQKIWDEIPKRIRKNPDVVNAYVQQLLLHNKILGPDTSEKIAELIRKTLKYHWQANLVRIYGTLPFTNLNKQLVIVGAWLKIYGAQPEILLTLGRLCVRVKLWGKAKDYFERCIAIGPNPEASLEYGKLLEQLGENETAIQKYQQGLEALNKHNFAL